MRMVVDTGSCVTLASDRTYKDLGSASLMFLPRPISLQDANGQELTVRGLFVMDTWFGDQCIPVDALVIQDLAPAVLLGMDFLNSLELRIPGMRPISLLC